jgi:hypothetical protein
MSRLPTAGKDLRWGQLCLAYNVEARFSDARLRSVAALQATLRESFAEDLKLGPPSTLHVSIYAIVPVRWDDAVKESHWQTIGAAAIAAVKEVCADQAKLKLQFSSWRVTNHAIIALAHEPSGLIDRLRERLSVLAKHPTMPAPTYEFIHSTLARFKSPGARGADTVEAFVRAPLELEVEVERVRIVRERVYPSLDLDEMYSAELGAGRR